MYLRQIRQATISCAVISCTPTPEWEDDLRNAFLASLRAHISSSGMTNRTSNGDCVRCTNSRTLGVFSLNHHSDNLRYVISSCIFAYPEEKQSISTPCQVSCESLRDAVGYGLRDPNGFTSYDFCDLNSFEDAVITKCTECYSQTEDEKYLANCRTPW